MAQELELKALVRDPAAVRARLLAAGAVPGFRGQMHDRRFDRANELTAREEVLRVRSYRQRDGRTEAVVTWKGPTGRSPEGYKQREELELSIAAGSAAPEALLEALGYRVSHAIDRFVEMYAVGAASARLEWYPRMDVLLEVEGEPEALEAAVAATGLDRGEFSAESLVVFAAHFALRTGHAAVLALADLPAGEVPAWPALDR
jgi:adenylate cyclase class IV